LAAENARRNGVEVELLQGDFFAPVAGRRFDAIACNPPYVSEAEFATLDPSVKDFEPKRALLGGVSGLEFYERLAREAPSHLKLGGQIFLEIGASQGEGIKKIFPEGELLFDWSGKARFFFLEKQVLSPV